MRNMGNRKAPIADLFDKVTIKERLNRIEKSLATIQTAVMGTEAVPDGVVAVILQETIMSWREINEIEKLQRE